MSDPRLGCVVIGRNEGERLQRCLRALDPSALPVVYVDSGSSGGSLTFARELGALVVDLDLSQPFTAARARNAGLARLRAAAPVAYVMFFDGDCEAFPGWLAAGSEALARELLRLDGGDAVATAIHSLVIGKALDRIADHAAIIGWRVRYLLTGDPAHLAAEIR